MALSPDLTELLPAPGVTTFPNQDPNPALNSLHQALDWKAPPYHPPKSGGAVSKSPVEWTINKAAEHHPGPGDMTDGG